MSVNSKQGKFILQPYLVGYMYNPEGPGTEAFFGNWISSPFAILEIPANFVKLVFVEGSQPADAAIPVYVNLTQYPNALELPFIIPRGWQVTGAYTDIDSGALKNLLGRSHSMQLAPSSCISLPALSAQSSSVDLTSWDNAFEDLVRPNDVAGALRFKSILQAHRPESPALTVMPIALGKFIPVDPPTFNKGINYSSTYFGLNFPAAWVIVLDARVKLRNVIHTSIGTGKSYDTFNSYATQFLSELEVLSGGIGHPIEKGTFPSCVMASLILANRNRVQYDRVHRIYDNYRTESPETGTSCTILREFYSMSDKYSQVIQERSSYKRSMKEHAITLVANPKKLSL
ncbi:hypothetical protein SCLCIDRAFT_28449, partial [Scleroderma citrinum Foug A]